MNKMRWITLGFLLTFSVFAGSPEAYLKKFNQYLEWSERLPASPSPEFISFIQEKTPLAQKLRDKWLYKLALEKNWQSYLQFYQDSTDVSLQCYKQIAFYHTGQTIASFQGGRTLWLTGDSRPPACNQLFDLMLKEKYIDDTLITKRVLLALDKQNLPLVAYLLKQYKPSRINEMNILTNIHQRPQRILNLTPSPLHGLFYLYGLKRMVSSNKDEVITIWKSAKTRQMLNHAEQQAFLSHLALYKAMRNHADARQWFKQIEPSFYNDTLVGWQIRLALKQKNWSHVEKLINQWNLKDDPCWQYWLARALEAQQKKEAANVIYQNLACKRHYYGFLSSLRLKQQLSFENEGAIRDPNILKPYQPFTNIIQSLYQSKQTLQASRLLNDFASELPKKDKSALVYWLANHLQWHAKSVSLSNTDALNNQLNLRFPLAYQNLIRYESKKYQVPPALIYAIIRQESSFREDVTSPAGAYGLMQLMPQTAKIISKQSKINFGDKKELFKSQKNINLGVAYLEDLSRRFHQHPLLMAAAYNAGPRQAFNWMKNHPPREVDIWIETLPWQETRNYLKNIVAFYAVYQYRMQSRPDLSPFMKQF